MHQPVIAPVYEPSVPVASFDRIEDNVAFSVARAEEVEVGLGDTVQALKEISPEEISHLSSVIVKEAERYGADPFLVMAVMNKESSFNPGATNHNTNGTIDRGLMQINSNTLPFLAEKLDLPATKETAFDPALNIKMGCFYLGLLQSKFDNDLYLALTAYNAGERRALAGKNDYSVDVMQQYEHYKELNNRK